MIYLIFDEQAQAQTALTQIWTNQQPLVEVNAATGLPVANPVTSCWAVEQQRLDGKWVFAKPEVADMTGVVDCTEEEYSDTWFEQEV
jgi:hypothetical protein